MSDIFNNTTGNAVMCCMSGSYTTNVPYTPPPPRKDAGVKEFFEKLGYKVSSDWSSWSMTEWWELHEDGRLVCQIDTNVPLYAIIQDLCQLHLGKEPNSDVDYTFNMPENSSSDRLFKRVYDFNTYNMLPDGQLLLKL